jgi:hypothetical protein
MLCGMARGVGDEGAGLQKTFIGAELEGRAFEDEFVAVGEVSDHVALVGQLVVDEVVTTGTTKSGRSCTVP